MAKMTTFKCLYVELEEKLEGEISQESEADEFLDSANELHFWIAK